MRATLLKGGLAAALAVGGGAVSGAGSAVRTFCNPMVVEGVPLSNFASILPEGERVPHRCLADPTLLRENGKWYLFPSCGQLWRSDDDGGTWRKVEGTGLTKPGHAPTAVRHGGRFLYMPDTTGEVWAAPTIEGRYERLGVIGVNVGGDVPPMCDPMLFSDTDGRLYFYWGCTAQGGIWGVELAKDDPLRPVTEPKELFRFDPKNQPWERVPGNPANGWLEGAWMAKTGGRYVLTYSAAGTQNPEYAMGAYVSDAPLGPFAAARDNPFLLTTKGLVTGTGHGAVAQDERGDWWVVYCANVGAHARFERLIGFDRLTARAEGGFEKASATSEPQWLPGFGKGATGWRRIAASTAAALAADDSLKTAHGFGGVTGTVEYRFPAAEIHATRIVWREDAVDADAGFKPGPIPYRIDVQTPGGAWETLIDASRDVRDLFVDYRETPPVKAVAARLVVLGAPAGIRLGVADWSLFGNGVGTK